jgi:hypothetical protein
MTLYALKSKIVIQNGRINLYLLFLMEIRPRSRGKQVVRKIFRPKWSLLKSIPGLAEPEVAQVAQQKASQLLPVIAERKDDA